MGGRKTAVVGVGAINEKRRSKAMKIASKCKGVDSVCFKGEGNQLVVSGCYDPVHLVASLSKKVGYAKLLSFGNAKPTPPSPTQTPPDAMLQGDDAMESVTPEKNDPPAEIIPASPAHQPTNISYNFTFPAANMFFTQDDGASCAIM